jgi:hypothetical protein
MRIGVTPYSTAKQHGTLSYRNPNNGMYAGTVYAMTKK